MITFNIPTEHPLNGNIIIQFTPIFSVFRRVRGDSFVPSKLYMWNNELHISFRGKMFPAAKIILLQYKFKEYKKGLSYKFIDGNINNLNIDNLEWITRSEKMKITKETKGRKKYQIDMSFAIRKIKARKDAAEKRLRKQILSDLEKNKSFKTISIQRDVTMKYLRANFPEYKHRRERTLERMNANRNKEEEE